MRKGKSSGRSGVRPLWTVRRRARMVAKRRGKKVTGTSGAKTKCCK